MNHDQIRRFAKDSERQQRDSMPALTDAVNRFMDRDDRTIDATSSVLLGGLTRRSLFKVGGVTVVGAALIAACGSDVKGASTTASSTSPATVPSTTVDSVLNTTLTTTPLTTSADITLLRTASSIENLAIAAYQIAIDSGLVTTAAVVSAAKLFQDHHRQHADLFQSTTRNMGGEAFTKPNPAVLAQLKPTIDALKDEQGVVRLALLLERAAAATYQAGVGTVTDRTLNVALMSVGGVEARHAAALAAALMDVPVPTPYGLIDAAIASGTGV